MKEVFSPGFWTMKRRMWLYASMVSLMPLLITAGTVTGEVAGMILNSLGVILGVSGGSMALANLTPDNVIKVGVELKEKDSPAGS